jgi:hypothetical protein
VLEGERMSSGNGAVHIGYKHLEIIKVLYSAFGENEFTFKDVTANNMPIYKATFGALYRGGSLSREVFRGGHNKQAHKWKLSEKAITALKVR